MNDYDDLLDYIISLKRGESIEDLKDKQSHLHESYKNDRKSLKPVLEFKKLFSIGTIVQSKSFLQNLNEDRTNLQNIREINRSIKKENKTLRSMYKYMRNLLEKQKSFIDCDLIDEDDITKEPSKLNDDNYFIYFKKNIELTNLLEKHKEYKEQMNKKFEDLEHLYKEEYHKSFMCQEHVEELNDLKRNLKKIQIENEGLKSMKNDYKNKWQNMYNRFKELELKSQTDIDLSDKVETINLHKKEMKKLTDKLKSNHEKELDDLEKKLKKNHLEQMNEKDKFLQSLLIENTTLKMNM